MSIAALVFAVVYEDGVVEDRVSRLEWTFADAARPAAGGFRLFAPALPAVVKVSAPDTLEWTLAVTASGTASYPTDPEIPIVWERTEAELALTFGEDNAGFDDAL